MKKLSILIALNSYYQIATISLLLCSPWATFSQEVYQPNSKNRVKESYVIETEEGNIPIKVRRVNGAIIFGDDIVLQPQGISTAIGARKYRRWADGVIPYRISENHPYKSQILDAIHILNSSTELWYRESYRFEEHEEFIYIIHDDGCYSGVGRPYFGMHSYNLSIGDGCEKTGTIIHELLHAAGLFHEHQRFDRDKYISIAWDNIKDGKKDNFEMPSKNIAKNIGDYNYNSVMHYSCKDFAKDITKPTISTPQQIGQREGLSQGDVDAISSMYYDISPNGKPIFTPISLPILTFPYPCGIIRTPDCVALLSQISSIRGKMKKREDQLKAIRIAQHRKDDEGGTTALWPDGTRKVGTEKGINGYVIYEENLLKDSIYKKLHDELQLLLQKKLSIKCN